MLLQSFIEFTVEKRGSFLQYSSFLLGVNPNWSSSDVSEGFGGLLLHFICGIFTLGTYQTTFLLIALFLTRTRAIFKIYQQSRGFGLNFYFRGKRFVAFDWHKFLVKHNQKKCLKKKDQYYVNRPHVDLVFLGIHHWPYECSEKAEIASEEESNERKLKAERVRENRNAKRRAKTERRKEKGQKEETEEIYLASFDLEKCGLQESDNQLN